MTSRREFLKAGLAGGILLNVAGCTPSLGKWWSATGVARRGSSLSRRRPARGRYTPAALAQTIAGVETAIAGLSLAAQKEIGELFDLLAFAPTRMLLAGVWSPWPEASAEAVGAFLERWRFSRFGLLNSGYAALHDLVFGAWYGHPDSWAAIRYPGPPEVK